MSKNKEKNTDEQKTKKPRTFKNLKHSAMSTILTVVFVAVVVLFNAVATMIFDKYPLTFDTTQNSIYSVSEETEDYLKTVNEDILITVLAKEDNFSALSNYTKQTVEFIKKYAQYNSHITYRFVDYLSSPDILSEYADESVSQYQIIVEANPKDSEGNAYRRLRVLDVIDLLDFNDEFEQQISSTYGMTVGDYIKAMNMDASTFLRYGGDVYVEASNAENALTSAVMTVCDPNPVKAAFLVGRNEVTQGEISVNYFKNLLEANGYEISEVNITTQEIEPDTDLILILAPTTDYTTEEIQKVDEFLTNDGKLGKNLIYAASVSQPQTPNLDEFLHEYSVEIPSSVVCESDANKYYTYPDFLSASVVTDNFLDDVTIAKEQLNIYVPDSRPINILSESGTSAKAEAYVQTTNSAYTVIYPDNKDDAKGVQNVMAVATKGLYDEDNNPLYSNVCVFGTVNMLSDGILNASQYQNRQFFLSVINGLCDKSQAITIEPKVISANTYDINNMQSRVLQVTFQYVIPGAVLAVGIVVWIKRKNR